MLQKIGIITKRPDQRALQATARLVEWLNQQGKSVTVVEDIAIAAHIPGQQARRQSQDNLPEGMDLVVVIGGDGTFIAAARAVGHRRVPILGVNMGRLGFLTEVPVEEMFATLEKVMQGEFHIEERTTLEVSVIRHELVQNQSRVLNDAVVHKGTLARMMEYNVTIDNQFVFSSRADGLIVATPTGSTAYALSAGGPIIHPALDALLLTPICPHTLTNRPIVVPGAVEISITLTSDDSNRLLTLDGQSGVQLESEDRIVIQRSQYSLLVMHPNTRNYYEILRTKLLWGERAGEVPLVCKP
ncbi:MAG: NAD(+) kinase [Magnetococcales bacterium]|nr:NAD(+)/NADH kinase [Magnetococcales bacterium]NGZ27095.1 NAD(+) kinase [Magnetococcales bacterium]